MANSNNNDKEVVFKNCALFTDYINEISNTKIANPKKIDIFMPMYNLIAYTNNYSNTWRSLWQYYRDEPFLDNVANFTAVNKNSASFSLR